VKIKSYIENLNPVSYITKSYLISPVMPHQYPYIISSILQKKSTYHKRKIHI